MTDATLIRGDRLLVGIDGLVVDDPILAVADGRVVDVFRGVVPEGFAAGAEIDLRGCTLLPGLIDGHVHLNMPGDGSLLEDIVREPDGVLTATAAFASARAVAAGITTVRDLGAARGTVFAVRRAQALGHGVGARIVACGAPLTITGGHCWYLGGEADGPDALRRRVREMTKQGADFIKVMASGGGTVGTQSWLPSFSAEELSAIVDEAHRLARPVAAHCLCAAASDMAVAAGVDHIEHAGFLIDAAGRQDFVPATAERIARAGIPVSATLAVGGFAVQRMAAKATRTPAEQATLDRWRPMLAENLAQFRAMLAAGVRFVAGTDAGWRYVPIEGLPMEVALMVEGGMAPLAAIEAATGVCAAAIGIGGTAGTLRAGMVADVIAVAGDPLADVRRLSDVKFVMQGGVTRRDGRGTIDSRGGDVAGT